MAVHGLFGFTMSSPQVKYTIYSIYYIQQIQHEIYNMYNMKYKTCTRSFLGLTMASPRLKMRRHLPLKSHDAQRSSNACTVLLQHNNNALKKNKLQSCDTFSKNYSALLKYKLSKVFRSYFSWYLLSSITLTKHWGVLLAEDGW